MNHFSVGFGSIDVDDVLDIHKYLMSKNNIKNNFEFMKKIFIGLLSFCRSLATNSMSLNVCQPFLVDLNTAGVKYYPYITTLDKCNGCCNILSEICGRIYASNKIENVSLNVFNLMTRTNDSK